MYTQLKRKPRGLHAQTKILPSRHTQNSKLITHLKQRAKQTFLEEDRKFFVTLNSAVSINLTPKSNPTEKSEKLNLSTFKIFAFQKLSLSQAPVAHTYNLRYLGG
jgi:hypothetical protein